ncbi:MAG: winged helix-turn-helix domain-containing protein [Campylobacterales bacterium]|nr:winged helix-turn-helix domain-containing protein [Campylobacterales bacterium]
MLKVLLGSKDKELVLQYLIAKKNGYASKIARYFDVKPSQIIKQLDSLEEGGVVVSFQVGNARVYELNPRYFFKDELVALLKKALSAYPPELQKKLSVVRTAPRKKGKKYILKGDSVETEL